MHSGSIPAGKTLVSTQMFVDNNAELTAEYSGDQAYKRSVKTYGGESSSFLTPGTATTTANNGSAGATETPPSSSDSDLGC